MWVFESCGYMFSKFEFCGYLNLWVFKICGCSRFIYTQNLKDYDLWVLKKSWVLKFVGILYSFIDTPILGHFHLWVLKICGYIKFVMIQNSR